MSISHVPGVTGGPFQLVCGHRGRCPQRGVAVRLRGGGGGCGETTLGGNADKTKTSTSLVVFVKLQCEVFSATRFTAVQWKVYKSITHFYRIVSPLLLKANGGNSLILFLEILY